MLRAFVGVGLPRLGGPGVTPAAGGNQSIREDEAFPPFSPLTFCF